MPDISWNEDPFEAFKTTNSDWLHTSETIHLSFLVWSGFGPTVEHNLWAKKNVLKKILLEVFLPMIMPSSTCFYSSSMSPAYKVMSRIAVKPVSMPTFCIMKKVKSVFLPVTFSLSMSFISGNWRKKCCWQVQPSCGQTQSRPALMFLPHPQHNRGMRVTNCKRHTSKPL